MGKMNATGGHFQFQLKPNIGGGQVAKFESVQGFWKLWNHMPQPSELLEQKRMVREQPEGLNVIDAIMIFREDIRPEWEDKMNATGGHFQFQLKPNIGGFRLGRTAEEGC